MWTIWIRFFLLLCLIKLSQASISTVIINADAAEISILNQEFKSNSPAIFRQSQSLVCEMINNCCSSIKPRLNEYLTSSMGDPGALVQACLGTYPPQSLLHRCPILRKFMTIAQDENFHKYIDVLTTASRGLQSPGFHVSQQTCSSGEAYALLCDWSRHTETESCERKTLLYVAQHRSDSDYRNFVQQQKQNLRLIIDAIKNAFPNESNSEATVLVTSEIVKKELIWPSSTTVTIISNGSSTFAQMTALITMIFSYFLLLAFFY
ncbi:unnamed protein product [Rotaria magnacalcarata]|uniref:Uncharacterized protein n=1 Tax=Rotaria magnacalcarata TaxID=392030 RepID=A0A815MWU1_9BILA|nr:unnamed protein product [Rotaria magnacalcarata]CAF1430784.1 unnamed protein product [Rotaria magnacalcarata]CAF2051863.1 unnamed protein product [Rotaria magnacalcarata]CAF2088780.1 unnamed protein product [Rotaria magnacalcarata]CAF2103372.1 unnamed protein product [Rotaria magnacalcarata]